MALQNFQQLRHRRRDTGLSPRTAERNVASPAATISMTTESIP